MHVQRIVDPLARVFLLSLFTKAGFQKGFTIL